MDVFLSVAIGFPLDDQDPASDAWKM